MDTQTCKTCHEEKPITEYHRRGAGHLKRCKTCVNTAQRERYAKSGKTTLPRQTSQFDRSAMPAVAETLKVIDSKLRAKAASYTNDVHEADDLYSRMVEHILCNAKSDESPALLLQRANWIAYDFIQKTRTYNHRVDTVEDVETVASASSVEDAIVASEVSEELKSVIEQLSPEYQQVVRLLSIGLSQREIARCLNVSEQAISQKVKRIGSTMMQMGFSPA
jgi:RNA polymerase sigma factor (sigma-70 family)